MDLWKMEYKKNTMKELSGNLQNGLLSIKELELCKKIEPLATALSFLEKYQLYNSLKLLLMKGIVYGKHTYIYQKNARHHGRI